MIVPVVLEASALPCCSRVVVTMAQDALSPAPGAFEGFASRSRAIPVPRAPLSGHRSCARTFRGRASQGRGTKPFRGRTKGHPGNMGDGFGPLARGPTVPGRAVGRPAGGTRRWYTDDSRHTVGRLVTCVSRRIQITSWVRVGAWAHQKDPARCISQPSWAAGPPKSLVVAVNPWFRCQQAPTGRAPHSRNSPSSSLPYRRTRRGRLSAARLSATRACPPWVPPARTPAPAMS